MTEMVEQPDRSLPVLERAPLRLTVTLEALFYLALGVAALLMRLAELDTIPLGEAEAREALAAWHFVSPAVPGNAPLATSPLLFALNSLFMSLMGGSELAARLATALGGAGLVLLPALWRQELGRLPALLTALLLLLSTSALAASRSMSPAVWAMLLALGGLWLALRFARERRAVDAVGASVLLLAALLLADPAGIALLLALLLGVWVTLRLSADDSPDEQPAPRLRDALAAWPWSAALGYGLAVVALVGTLLMLFPAGLAQVGELAGRGLAGFVSRPAGQPFALPLLVSLLYEPLLWLLGALGILYTLRTSRAEGVGLLDRFLVGWLFGGLVLALVYAGAGPAHALWLSVPLAALGGRALARVLAPVDDPLWKVPGWAVPALGAGYLALLFVSATNFVFVARALQGTAPGMTAAIQPLRLLLAGMSLLLLGILYFLGASLWGPKAAWKSIVLALVFFLGTYGLSGAWRVAVTHVDDPRELWHVAPVDRELALLPEAISEASLRETGGPYQLAFTASMPDDGAVAWQLRQFVNLRYVPAVDARAADPVLLTPGAFRPETLGARYVGREFIVRRGWPLAALRWESVPAWIMYGEAQAPAQVLDSVNLWVRDDVYGLPPAAE